MSNAYNVEGHIIAKDGETVRLKYDGQKGKFQQMKYDDYQKYHTPYVRTERKIGRNDPCPCGSGKKFKKCHIGK